MNKDFEVEIVELMHAANASPKAARMLVSQCYSQMGEYDLGWCLERFSEAKVKALIQLGDEEEERICRENPPFGRR